MIPAKTAQIKLAKGIKSVLNHYKYNCYYINKSQNNQPHSKTNINEIKNPNIGETIICFLVSTGL